MLLRLNDSIVETRAILAVTKGIIPSTLATPQYFTCVVHIANIMQPIVYTFETEEERDEVYEQFCTSMLNDSI